MFFMISCYGNPVKIHPERITQNDKKLANNMMGLSFLCKRKILVKLKRKATFTLMCFVMI